MEIAKISCFNFMHFYVAWKENVSGNSISNTLVSDCRTKGQELSMRWTFLKFSQFILCTIVSNGWKYITENSINNTQIQWFSPINPFIYRQNSLSALSMFFPKYRFNMHFPNFHSKGLSSPKKGRKKGLHFQVFHFCGIDQRKISPCFSQFFFFFSRNKFYDNGKGDSYWPKYPIYISLGKKIQPGWPENGNNNRKKTAIAP